MQDKSRLKTGIVQFIKFNLVGVLNTLVDFIVYTALTALGLNITVSNVISYGCGIANSYICNSSWTFKGQQKRSVKEALMFLAVNLVSLGVSTSVLHLCRYVFNIQSDILCKVISIPCAMVANFAGNKLFVFKDTPKEETAEEPDNKP